MLLYATITSKAFIVFEATERNPRKKSMCTIGMGKTAQ